MQAGLSTSERGIERMIVTHYAPRPKPGGPPAAGAGARDSIRFSAVLELACFAPRACRIRIQGPGGAF